MDKKRPSQPRPSVSGQKPQKRGNLFTQEELQNFAGFYHALKKVYVRLIKEGYTVVDGELRPPKKRKESS